MIKNSTEHWTTTKKRFKTFHKVIFEDARHMKSVSDNSVDLILTSPPYPMIQMWDSIFWEINQKISQHLGKNEWTHAFELMHKELDKIREQVNRVLKEWGIACINIWDATRSINGSFALYNNHSRIITTFVELWFVNLPNIIRRKTTNAPNKFMGSWVMPVGAYVTLEHEYILVFRKGKKREFKTAHDKDNRQKSSFFFEERNVWFSDIRMGLTWVKQKMNASEIRERSAAYPLELAYRLINMFSVYGDTVLDPFLWTWTTTLAAMIAWRNSYGIEIDKGFAQTIEMMLAWAKAVSASIIAKRLSSHELYVKEKLAKGGDFKYTHKAYTTPVVSGVEQHIVFHEISDIKKPDKQAYEVTYL